MIYDRVFQDAIFSKLVIDRHQLKEFANLFLENKKVILDRVLEDAIFSKLVIDAYQLKEFTNPFPENKKVILDRVLEDAILLKRIIGGYQLKEFINLFPEDKKTIFEKIAEDDVFYKILDRYNVIEIADMFPVDIKNEFFSKYFCISIVRKDSLRKGIKALIDKFIKINSSHSNDFQKRDLVDFFTAYTNKLGLLIYLMSDNALTWMRNSMAKTVLPLERLLSDIPYDRHFPEELKSFLALYFEGQSKLITEKQNFPTCKNIILGVYYHYKLCNINNEVRNFNRNIYDLHITEMPDDFLKYVNSLLIEEISKFLSLNEAEKSNINLDQLYSSISANSYIQLIVELVKLRDRRSHYATTLEAFVRCHLTKQSIDHFLHNTEQENPLGKTIAIHNKRIQDLMAKHGFAVDTALHYPGHYEFSLRSEKTIAREAKENNMSVLYGYLGQITDVINKVLEKRDGWKEFGGAISTINRVLKSHKQLMKDEKTWLQRYENFHWGCLEEININLKALLQNETINNSEQLKTLREFSEHFISQFIEVQKQKMIPSASAKESMPANFRIAQWDKSKITTFFLGNEVDCCLAAGSEHFEAMVQRMLDDAMQFHVVVDLATQKPIALTWLYFAEDTNDAQPQPYLVGNFIEIKTKYGSNAYSRDTIIAALLYFTGEMYCPAVGIKKFIINELTYGWASDNKVLSSSLCPTGCFPMESVLLKDKLGGAFVPNAAASTDTEHTCRYYYLASLLRSVSTPENSKFYVYTLETLSREMRRLGFAPTKPTSAIGSPAALFSAKDRKGGDSPAHSVQISQK